MSTISDFKYPRPETADREMTCPKCGAFEGPTIRHRSQGTAETLVVSCSVCGYDYGTVRTLDE